MQSVKAESDFIYEDANKNEAEIHKPRGSITIEEMGFSMEGPDNPSGVTVKKFNVDVFVRR